MSVNIPGVKRQSKAQGISHWPPRRRAQGPGLKGFGCPAVRRRCSCCLEILESYPTRFMGWLVVSCPGGVTEPMPVRTSFAQPCTYLAQLGVENRVREAALAAMATREWGSHDLILFLLVETRVPLIPKILLVRMPNQLQLSSELQTDNIKLMSDQEQQNQQTAQLDNDQGAANEAQPGVEDELQGDDEVPAPEVVDPPPNQKTEEEIQEELRRQEELTKQRQQQARQKAEEQKIKIEQDAKKLDEALKGGLSKIGKTTDGGSSMYTSLSISQKQIQVLFPTIWAFQGVRYLDISSNMIVDICLLSQFRDLVVLNASKNLIASTSFFDDPNSYRKLQVLNLSGNKIKELGQIDAPELFRLNLNENEIERINWKGHPSLQYLELRKNKLKRLNRLANLPNLIELYLSENEITDFRALENLPQLKKLYLRGNRIKRIYRPFPFLPKLEHLNLRQNQLDKVEDIDKIDKHIRSVNLLENPVAEQLGENLKKDFSCIYPQIQTINKSLITPQQRKQFQKEYKEKLAEQERERLQREAQEEQVRKQEVEARRLEQQELRQKQAQALQSQEHTEEANETPQEQDPGVGLQK